MNSKFEQIEELITNTCLPHLLKLSWETSSSKLSFELIKQLHLKDTVHSIQFKLEKLLKVSAAANNLTDLQIETLCWKIKEILDAPE